MNILHDKSSVKSSSAKWIDRGYAREDVHSLRLQYVYTPEQREANRQICDDGPDEAHRRIKRAAESKNAVMASVMAAIAREFICYQYKLKIRRLTEVPVGNCFSGATTSAIHFTAMGCPGVTIRISHCPLI